MPAKLMPVRWARPALAHLQEIAAYIAQDDPAAAYRLITHMRRTAELMLAKNSLVGRQGPRADTRELIAARTKHIVSNRVRAEDVEMLTVYHGARGNFEY